MAVTTILLITTTVLVMAEEFEQLPKKLQSISAMLVHNRNCRTAFICIVIILMSTAVSMSLIFGHSSFNASPKDNRVFEVSVAQTQNDMPVADGNILFESKPEVSSKQEIILNLFLTATVHHNVTFNNFKMKDYFDKEHCSEECVAKIFKQYILHETADNNKRDEDESFRISDNNQTDDLINNTETNDNNNCTDLNIDECENGDDNTINKKTDDTKEAEYNCTKNNSSCTSQKNKKIQIIRLKRELNNVNSTQLLDNQYYDIRVKSDEHECSNKNPEFVVFLWVLCLIALATALKLYYLIKTFLAILMVVSYTAVLIVGEKKLDNK